MNGSVGAEPTPPARNYRSLAKFATGVWLGDFMAMGTGTLEFTISTTGYLTLWDGTAQLDPMAELSDDSLTVGVATAFTAIVDGGGVDLYSASAELSNTDDLGTPGVALDLVGDWANRIGDGITADKILDINGMLVDDPLGSDCGDTTGDTPHCSYAFDITDMVTLDNVMVGDRFSLFLTTGTVIIGTGNDYMLAAAFNGTTGMDIMGGPEVMRLQSELAVVPEPASLALMITGLLGVGVASHHRRKH